MNNGIRHKENVRIRARKLRGLGYTHREISKKLGATVSSVHLWTQQILITDEQKKEIQKRWYKKYILYVERHKDYLGQQARKYLSDFWKKPYTKKDLLTKIISFHKKHKRIPLKREFNMYREYKGKFGSWNNAVRMAGFDVNPELFAKHFIANDGHKCDSFAEKIIDDWLHQQNIRHRRHISYSSSKMTADFAIGKTRIEYFGLATVNKRYDKNIKKKRQLCKDNYLKLVEIYPKDLFGKYSQNFLTRLKKDLHRK